MTSARGKLWTLNVKDLIEPRLAVSYCRVTGSETTAGFTLVGTGLDLPGISRLVFGWRSSLTKLLPWTWLLYSGH